MSSPFFVSTGGVYAVAILFPVLASAAVGARFYVRRSRRVSLGSDDWTILAALAIIVMSSVILLYGAATQVFGTHTLQDPLTGEVEVTPKDIMVVQLDYAETFVLMLGFGIVKISVLLFYRRIFVGEMFRRWSLAICAIVCLWTVSFIFVLIFECGTHPSAPWTSPQAVAEYCDNMNAEWLAYAVLDVITDFLVLLTPFPKIWKLQMPRAQRVALSGIFLLGFFSTAVAILRLVWVVYGPFQSSAEASDLRAVDTIQAVWGHIEVGTAVCAACLPTLRPLFHGLSPETMFGSWRSKISLQSLPFSQSRSSKTTSSAAMDEPLHHPQNAVRFRPDTNKSDYAMGTMVHGHPWGDRRPAYNGIMLQKDISFEEEQV